MGGRAVSTDSIRLEEGQQQISAAGFVGIPKVNGMGSRTETAVSACAGIVLNVGQETLLQQPAGQTIPDVAKPLRCRPPTPGQGLVHNARGGPDDAAGVIK
jgi:hypothetical protein